MQQAREFLSRVLPWPPAGQPGAYMNIHNSFEKAGQPKLLWGGRACTSLNEAVQAVAYRLGQPDTKGIYVCMSSQRIAVPKQTANGYTILNAQRSSNGAIEIKSFYIDIDVKLGAYSTQQEAFTAFGDFLNATGLPQPTATVETGSGGFHVHWLCNRPMQPDEWKPYARALANAVIQHGLIADTECTVDIARILRIPNTFNQKSGTAQPVKFLTQMLPADYDNQIIFDILQPYVGQVQASAPAPGKLVLPAAFGAITPQSNVPVTNAMSAGIAREARPVILQDVVTECAFIRDAFKDGGKDYDNTLWNLTTLIATFAEDGRALAHDMAKGHSTYTELETDALFTRKMADRISNNIGWPGCRTIANSGCTACQTCPHLNAGKSPLHFAASYVPAPASLPPPADMPGGYMRDANNLVYRMSTKDDGELASELVSSYPMGNGWIQENPSTFLFKTTTNVGRKIQIGIPLKDLDGRDKMAGCLRTQGFLVQQYEIKKVGEFMVSWSKELQKIKNAVVNTPAFGWHVGADGKDEGFAYGGILYTPSEERITMNAPSGLDLQYKPRGALEPWQDAARVITNQKRPELDLIIAAGFAGPLMKFAGQAGVMISAFSADSGVGKSSAMKVGQSIWGDPVTAMSSLDDTKGSVLEKVGSLKNLPLMWDEMKGLQNLKSFVEVLFGIVQGKGKARLTQDIAQREVKQWQTIAIVASNASLIDSLNVALQGTEAGILRLYEYEVPPARENGPGILSMGEASNRLQNTHNNYGKAGEVYAKFLGQSHEQIGVEVLKTMHSLEKKMSGVVGERFWFAAAAVLISGARYANYLKLTEIDETALAKLCMKIIRDMRGHVKSLSLNIRSQASVWDILTSFLSEMRARHTLTTNIIPTGAGAPIRGSVKILKDTSKLEGIYVQIAVESGIIRIARTKLMRFLVERGYSRHQFLGELEKDFGFRNLNSARLGGGTALASGNQFLLESFALGTPLQGWLEDSGDTLPGTFKTNGAGIGETHEETIEGETIEKAIIRSKLNPTQGGQSGS